MTSLSYISCSDVYSLKLHVRIERPVRDSTTGYYKGQQPRKPWICLTRKKTLSALWSFIRTVFYRTQIFVLVIQVTPFAMRYCDNLRQPQSVLLMAASPEDILSPFSIVLQAVSNFQRNSLHRIVFLSILDTPLDVIFTVQIVMRTGKRICLVCTLVILAFSVFLSQRPSSRAERCH